MFARGGNAVDAAIATNAAIAVTGPHLCGMGGDLFALVHVDGEVHALNASRPRRLRRRRRRAAGRGSPAMPFRHDVAPSRFPAASTAGSRSTSASVRCRSRRLFARRAAGGSGFPASPLLAGSLGMLDEPGRASSNSPSRRTDGVPRAPPRRRAGARGDRRRGRSGYLRRRVRRRPARARRRAVHRDDLAPRRPTGWRRCTRASSASTSTRSARTRRATSTLGGAIGSPTLDLPTTPTTTVGAPADRGATAAGYDRPDVLHERADGDALLDVDRRRLGSIDLERASPRRAPGRRRHDLPLHRGDGRRGWASR